MERHTKSYLRLIKPGIVLSNTIATVAGFLLASRWLGFDVWVGVGVTGGVALIIASACVINNMLDRHIDARMKRTKERGLPAGTISLRAATLYAVVLGAAGFWLLYALTNQLTVWLGVIAYVWYVAIYGAAKRTTPLSTIIGAVCGALPPMAGYTAMAGQVDAAAWVLFWVLMVWQLPHFYAIAVFRENDYRNAGIPVWPVVLGAEDTKAQIMFWTVIFALVAPLLTVVGVAGGWYFAIAEALALYWVWQGAINYKRESAERWARRMFGISLLVLLVLCAAIAVGAYLP